MVAAEEHVGDVERSIRIVKEGTCCHVHRLPYERYTKLMVMGCVTKSIKGSNQLPSTNGLSKEISPSTMITGKLGPDYNQICKLNFGDYVQAYRRNGATNTNNARSVGAIALFPSGNDQNGWYFMSLATGKRIHCYQ